MGRKRPTRGSRCILYFCVGRSYCPSRGNLLQHAKDTQSTILGVPRSMRYRFSYSHWDKHRGYAKLRRASLMREKEEMAITYTYDYSRFGNSWRKCDSIQRDKIPTYEHLNWGRVKSSLDSCLTRRRAASLQSISPRVTSAPSPADLVLLQRSSVLQKMDEKVHEVLNDDVSLPERGKDNEDFDDDVRSSEVALLERGMDSEDESVSSSRRRRRSKKKKYGKLRPTSSSYHSWHTP